MSVFLAMRYGKPAIRDVVARMVAEGITDLLVIPQYAHYAMSSWETVVVRVHEELAAQAPETKVRTVQPFYADADYIDALSAVSAPYLSEPHDHVLFSFHGLPVRHLRKADSSGAHCTRMGDCCTRCSPAHATCYRSQVFATTQALARKAGLTEGRYSVAFQSRLAGEPWLEPCTDHELARLAREGVRRLLVICPAFVADCLETLEEISVEGRRQFLDAGERILHPDPVPQRPKPLHQLSRWTRAPVELGSGSFIGGGRYGLGSEVCELPVGIPEEKDLNKRES